MDFIYISDISENSRPYRQDSFNGNSSSFYSLFLLSFIVRSLNKNVWKFEPYINGLTNKPDKIVLSENWFEESDIDNTGLQKKSQE